MAGLTCASCVAQPSSWTSTTSRRSRRSCHSLTGSCPKSSRSEHPQPALRPVSLLLLKSSWACMHLVDTGCTSRSKPGVQRGCACAYNGGASTGGSVVRAVATLRCDARDNCPNTPLCRRQVGTPCICHVEGCRVCGTSGCRFFFEEHYFDKIMQPWFLHPDRTWTDTVQHFHDLRSSGLRLHYWP